MTRLELLKSDEYIIQNILDKRPTQIIDFILKYRTELIESVLSDYSVDPNEMFVKELEKRWPTLNDTQNQIIAWNRVISLGMCSLMMNWLKEQLIKPI